MDNENMNCNYEVTGINAQSGLNTNNTINDINNTDKEKLLNEIRQLDFAITDLALYLNTHPTDEKALCLHQNYCNQIQDLRNKYQQIFGPLTIYCPCDKWKWLNNPWPWEGSEE